MTDRINSFLVVLDKDLRDDDVENTITALNQIKGVIAIRQNISDPAQYIAESRIKRELIQKLWDLLKE